MKLKEREAKIEIKNGLASIERPERNEAEEFKSKYDRFVIKQESPGLLSRARNFVNKLQAEGYSKNPSLLAKILTWLYTPAPSIDPCRLVDVGCGTGGFLANLPNNWEAEGLEVNLEACKIALGKGLKVYNTSFEKVVPVKKYDLVRCCHVLEHVRDYEAFIGKAAQMLTDGGLVIIYTPNLNSFSRLVFGDLWEGYYDDTHFNIYTPMSLEQVTKKYDFDTKKTKTYFMGYTAATLSRALRVKNRNLRAVVILITTFLTFPVELVLSKFGLGDAIYMEFKLHRQI